MSGKPNQNQNLELVTQPEEFFRELVTSALKSQKVRARAETEFYLVNLLKQFMTTENLYAQDADGTMKEEPLALMVKEAMEEQDAEAQRHMFRHVGDFSLYVAGFFGESLSRKMVDVGYYIGMGGAAYSQVAARVEEKVVRVMYGELSDRFGRFVDVIAEVSDKTSVTRTEADLLRMYDLYQNTKSARAARLLKEAGILPVDDVKKRWQ